MGPDEISSLLGFADKIGTLAMALLVITYLWRSWTAERLERDKERDELLAKIDTLQNARVEDARKWGESMEQMLHGSLNSR